MFVDYVGGMVVALLNIEKNYDDDDDDVMSVL